jgi:hypothetical protein
MRRGIAALGGCPGSGAAASLAARISLGVINGPLRKQEIWPWFSTIQNPQQFFGFVPQRRLLFRIDLLTINLGHGGFVVIFLS